MKRWVTSLLLLISAPSIAQSHDRKIHCHTLNAKTGVHKTTIAHAAEDHYDVKYVKLDLQMSNTTTALEGHGITQAVVTAPSMATFVFELSNLLNIDSAFVNGVAHPVVSTGSIRSITLSAPLPAGTSFTAKVYYHGTPLSGTMATPAGINTAFDPLWHAHTTFTTSECYHAHEWWPCKQSLRDKIDSADIWITVADSLKAGSNGLLTAVTPVAPGRARYEWHEGYAIDYYLLSVAVGPYDDNSRYMHFTGSGDSMLVQNYIYRAPGVLAMHGPHIDSAVLMIDYFSTLFGRYPFWREKYGHSMAYIGGGMENQTMSTVYYFDPYLISHELGHQWFGDNVTCATWRDIMMNEGFANYATHMFEEHFYGFDVAAEGMYGVQNYVKSAPGGTVYVDDTTDEDRIFDSRLTYCKSMCVIHMLRSIVNDDAGFFHILRIYQNQLKDSTATIEDFKNVVKAEAGTVVNEINIDTFFNQWVYLEGYPEYSFRWNQVGGDVYVKLDQTTAVPASVPLFKLPLDLRLHSSFGDTIVRVTNTAASQVYHFTWSKPMISLMPDPKRWNIYELKSNVRDYQLGLPEVAPSEITIAPNPSYSAWLIGNLPQHTALVLMDITGKAVWSSNDGRGNYSSISAHNLMPGQYTLQVWKDNTVITTCKLVRL